MRRTNTAVWLEKYQRWQIKVQKDGERRTFTSSIAGRKGQRACNAKADAWLDDQLIEPDTKVEKLFEQWLESLKVTTGTANYKQYSSYWNTRIKKRIGSKKAGALTEKHLQDIINDGMRDGLSKKTLQNIQGCLAAFCKYMRKCKASTLRPENIIIPQSAPSGSRVILQPDEIKMLFFSNLSSFRGEEVIEPLVYAWRLQVLTGLRPGELVGLRWSDIDMNTRIVDVKRSINDLSEETTGKNENARRRFLLSDTAFQTLKEYKESVSMYSIYVFPNSDNDQISQKEVYNRWKRYKAYNGIDATTTPYELRHTFVSIFKDLPEGLMKPLVGHSVKMDTYGTYGHEVTDDMQRTAELMQARVNEVLK